MTQKLPAGIVKLIQSASDAASCKNASFGSSHETVIYQGKEISVDAFVKERIRLHHEMWVISRLERVLKWSRGEAAAPGRYDY